MIKIAISHIMIRANKKKMRVVLILKPQARRFLE